MQRVPHEARGRTALLAALALAVLAPTGQAYAVPILDQVNLNPQASSGAQAAFAAQTWMQQVTVGVSGTLTQIDILVGGDPTLGARFNFFVNIGSGWQADPSEFESIIAVPAPSGPGPSGWVGIDVSAASIHLNAGDTFLFGWGGVDTALPGAVTNPTVRIGGDTYAGGDVWLNGALWIGGGGDAIFQTYMETGMVPEPGSLVLLGSGLLGIAGGARRRQVTRSAGEPTAEAAAPTIAEG